MSEPRVLYHCAPIMIGLGSIILPGNWGRVLSTHSYRHHHFQREMMFEFVRQREVPEAPSRLQCIFAFASLDEAQQYIAVEDAKAQLVYECEQIDPSAKTWIAPLNAFSMRASEAVMAEQYWQHSRPIAESSGASTNFMGMGRVAYEVMTMSALLVTGGPFIGWTEMRPHDADKLAL